jgi:hypothetical protein
MNFQSFLEKIELSSKFKDFKIQNPDAELIAGFFIQDFLDSNDSSSLDYKAGEKIFTFSFSSENEILIKEDELIKNPNIPELNSINSIPNIELNELKGLAGIEAHNQGIAQKFQKIIAVLQNSENKLIWNLTCMLDGLIILHILIDADTGKIIKFEKRNLMEFVKKA